MKVTNKFKHSLKTTGLRFKEGKIVNENLIVRVYETKKEFGIVFGLDSKFNSEEFLLNFDTAFDIADYFHKF